MRNVFQSIQQRILRPSVLVAAALLILVAAALLMSGSPAFANPPIPNGSLLVTYRQKEEGKLSESVHLLELECFNDVCAATTLTLNQCVKSPDLGPVFPPKVERCATENGCLHVSYAGLGILVAKETGSGATFTYRFEFTTRRIPVPGLRSDTAFGELKAFGGTASEFSDVLGGMHSWDLVALKGQYSAMRLSCAAMLPGVPK